MKPEYIFLHTAASGKLGEDWDVSAADIRKWHVEGNGWDDIGYHYVIRKNGTLETGRSLDQAGTHVAGINNKSVGICFAGHGDYAPWTQEQWATALSLIPALMRQFSIPASHVLGHREVNLLVEQGILASRYKTSKTCPGNMVDMDAVRDQLTGGTGHIIPRLAPMIRFHNTQPVDPATVSRTKRLQRFLREEGLYQGAIDGWAGKGTSGAVRELLGTYLLDDPRNEGA